MLTSYNPAHPVEVVGSFDEVSAPEIDRRVATAVEATRSWMTSGAQRARALVDWAQAVEADSSAVAHLIAAEVGKPISEARGEVARGVAILRYYGQLAFDGHGEIFSTADGLGELRVERHALGVVLAITPWNFPLAIPLWKVAPALATGNSVLLKPSSQALAVAHHLVSLADGLFPGGVLQLVVAQPNVTEGLLSDTRIAAVSFTGSVATGRRVIELVARRGGAVQAEMGGQNAAIVLDDADIESAASSIAGAAMQYAGQKCTATSRAIVQRTVARDFTDALIAAVARLTVADPLDEKAEVGPLISQTARAAVAEAARGALGRGGRLLVGGDILQRDGWFWQPTIVGVSDPLDPFAQEEVFGPAMSVLVVDSEDDAVDVANGTRYGLAGAVYGRDLERAQRVGRGLDVGLLRINAPTTGVDFHVPFGGVKDSSYGPREQGRTAGLFYTTTRTVTVRGV